jgi:hypothetical protein
MTTSIADLHLEIVGDMQKCFYAYLRNLDPSDDFSQEQGWTVSVLLHLHINLRQSPDNKLISSAEKNQPFYLSSQHAQFIETYATDNYFTREAALTALIKLSLHDHKNLRIINRLVRGKSAGDTHVTLDFELVGPMEWHERYTDDPTA